MAHARQPRSGFLTRSATGTRYRERFKATSGGRDGVAAPGEGAVPAGRVGETADQLGAQLSRLDDRVDDQLRGEVEDVDVLRVLLALGDDEGLPLCLVLDRLDLVEEDRVDGGLWPHHRDRGARQGDAAIGLEGGPGHRV